jgi:hypothetical protein
MFRTSERPLYGNFLAGFKALDMPMVGTSTMSFKLHEKFPATLGGSVHHTNPPTASTLCDRCIHMLLLEQSLRSGVSDIPLS